MENPLKRSTEDLTDPELADALTFPNKARKTGTTIEASPSPRAKFFLMYDTLPATHNVLAEATQSQSKPGTVAQALRRLYGKRGQTGTILNETTRGTVSQVQELSQSRNGCRLCKNYFVEDLADIDGNPWIKLCVK